MGKNIKSPSSGNNKVESREWMIFKLLLCRIIFFRGVTKYKLLSPF